VTPARQKVTQEELADILVTHASALLGHDASFIASHMKLIRREERSPNWDAKLDIFGSVVITDVFNRARERTKALYELE
jgi:hypothetical protein